MRTVAVVWLAVVIAMIGMSLVIPFLPLYLTELHVPPDQLKLWAGWIGGANFLVAALFAPIWGTLADRVGRKPMAIRALVGLAVATPTFAYSAAIRSDSYLAILFRLGMIPMSLFSGVFFPVESLPALLRWIAYALPLWHGVDLSRAAMLGVAPAWSAIGHLLYLALWVVVGWLLALRQFSRRLVV